ncbi:protein-L-isoaspartate O-methyltransferase [Gulosibacter sp. 10]|uniref:protein-L-isoaspartate O-methyltransferase n=1 Tax=Gulosibacter sp. 10 TaxID=1255570 RepID=UPI00097F45C2|nr:protein-L-isoaspartate O-methyltransferase [Gulosibacter sp. 10]SJM70140.1 Protein-L-isoaspartate O-methyltransferase [Gulosibacter sp. 10]
MGEREPGGAPDPVPAAMSRAARERFLPRSARARADHDGPLRIGYGQTSSQPRTVAAMLRLLDVRPAHRVLDLGSGSGWTTAILGELVGPEGRVIGVERIPQLVERSRAALREHGGGPTEIRQARPGVLGAPESAPFDRILVSAEAGELPMPLVRQLADGGVMVIPVRERLLRVVRSGDEARITRHGAYVFVPLVE